MFLLIYSIARRPRPRLGSTRTSALAVPVTVDPRTPYARALFATQARNSSRSSPSSSPNMCSVRAAATSAGESLRRSFPPTGVAGPSRVGPTWLGAEIISASGVAQSYLSMANLSKRPHPRNKPSGAPKNMYQLTETKSDGMATEERIKND